MMFALLFAGIALLAAGLAAIGFGIPVNEFSFGNTLILSGTVVACTGMILIGLWIVTRVLRNTADRLGMGVASPMGAGVPVAPAIAMPRRETLDDQSPPFNRDEPTPENPGQPASPPPQPWREETLSRDRGANEAAEAEAAPAAKGRRNLLFSSSSRKERERAESRGTDPAVPVPSPGRSPSGRESNPVSPPATFEDAWPQPERAKAPDAPPRRSSRPLSTVAETHPGDEAAAVDSPPVRVEEPPPVTVLKSGVVDGMAYSLYSDGSIEAQMPEGMMRFASIDELRSHLDQRP